jgi:hypothetical protein
MKLCKGIFRGKVYILHHHPKSYLHAPIYSDKNPKLIPNYIVISYCICLCFGGPAIARLPGIMHGVHSNFTKNQLKQIKGQFSLHWKYSSVLIHTTSTHGGGVCCFRWGHASDSIVYMGLIHLYINKRYRDTQQIKSTVSSTTVQSSCRDGGFRFMHGCANDSDQRWRTVLIIRCPLLTYMSSS